MSTRKLEVELIGDNSHLSRAMRGAARDSDTLGSRLRSAGAVGAKALAGIGSAAIVGAAYGIKKSIDAARESNKVGEQTLAVLKSTGHSAKISATEVASLSGAISRKAGVDDEAIQSGANLLLTFKEIRNEQGKGNDIFNQATSTIVDMSVALDQDLKSSAIQVGKALNDPLKGMTALQRVGVSFSEDQKEMVEGWVEQGDVLRAQKFILQELTSEFGGSAAAQADGFDKIGVSVENVQESIGGIFLPLAERAANKLNEDVVPKLQRTAGALASIAERDDIDLEEKLGLAGNVIARDWSQLPGQIDRAIDKTVPVVAERAGDLGVAVAEGTLNGFLNADPIGKAAIALWASRFFGGPGALIGAGRQVGSKFGSAISTESAVAMAAGFNLSSGGSRAFGLIDRTRQLGKTVGKVGLGLGLLEGAQAVLQSPADGLVARLEQIDAQGKGLIGSIERNSGLADLAGGIGIDSWASQGDAAHELLSVLNEINVTHGRRHDLLVAEARALADQLGLTRKQRKEVEDVARAQEIANQTLEAGLQGLGSGRFTRLEDISAVVRRNSQAIEEAMGSGTREARDAAAENFRAAADAIEVGMDRGVISTRDGMAEIRRLTRQAHLVSGDDPWGIAKGFERSWRRAGGITDEGLRRISQDLDKMPPQAARTAARMMLNMAREMRQKGQLSKAEVERLRSAVVTKLDQMARQGGAKGDVFEGRVSKSFEGLSDNVLTALDNIGFNVATTMKELGAGNIPQFALKSLARQFGGSGGKYVKELPEIGRARGGPITVSGQGLYDTVPVMVNGALKAVVAPEETLVAFTRHQRPLVDRALANEYGVNGLQGFTSTFDRPNYLARGGIVEPHLSGSEPLRSLGQAGIHKTFTAAEAFIARHQPKGGGAAFHGGSGTYPGVSGDTDFTPALGHALSRMARSAGTSISVTSGWRSYAEQAALYQLYKEGKGNLAAPPGSSNHEDGRAADISPGRETFGTVAGRFGLGFTVPSESWHIELLQRGGVIGYGNGGVITGKVSYFNGPASTTASGTPVSRPGLALNLNPGTDSGWDNETTRGWMEAAQSGHPVYGRTTIAGHTANLPIIDLGPAGSTGRAIDVTEAGVHKLGLDPASFPTDSIGKVVILGGGSAAGKKRRPQARPGRTGKGGGTEGPYGKKRKGERDPRSVISLPGLEAGKVPKVLGGLPSGITSLFKGPGLTRDDRFAASEIGLQVAGTTEDTADDRALYQWQIGASKQRKEAIQREIQRIDKLLLGRLTKKQRQQLFAKRNALREELATVQGRISSAHEGIAGLGEGEGDEDAHQEAIEKQTEAIEEHTRMLEEQKAETEALRKEMELTRHIAESEIATAAAVAKRALTDIIAGELGPRSYHRAQTAGAGTVGSL